jgi:uncharacterized membrane protein YgcG
MSASEAQYNLDIYNSLATNTFTYGIFNAQQNYLFNFYLDIKYGDVSLSPELEAMEKIGFLIFEDAFKAMIIEKWKGIVKAEQDAIDAAAAAAAANTGGGGGGGGGGTGGGGSSGGGYGSSGGWYVSTPTITKTGSISIGEPLEGTGIVQEKGKAV